MWRERRIDIRFDGSTLAQIQEIERLSGKGTLTILEECVHLTNWLLKERMNGAELWIREPHPEADLREVVFL